MTKMVISKFKRRETLTENPNYSFIQKSGKNYERVKKANLDFLNEMKIGFTLNICCGQDPIGDVLADIDKNLIYKIKKSRITKKEYVICDVRKPPFRKAAFDTVICDPPFSLYNSFKWIVGLSELAKKRLILCVPQIELSLDSSIWEKELYYIRCGNIFLRLWWVFTKTPTYIDKEV